MAKNFIKYSLDSNYYADEGFGTVFDGDFALRAKF